MPKIYCSSCGNPLQYSDVKPNFCFKCGSNLSTGRPQIITQQIQSQIQIEEAKPKINNLNWDIEIQKPKGISLKDLAKGEKINYEPIEVQERLSKEEVLKRFKKEAGTLRGKNFDSTPLNSQESQNDIDPDDGNFENED